MADPLSILSLAIQLTQSIVAIKRFCMNVKDAPADLLELVEELSHMNAMIEALARKQSTNPDGDRGDINFKESLRYCRQASQRLETFVTAIRELMATKRLAASWRFVTHRDEIKSMTDKLLNSKFDLTMAYQLLAFESQASMLQTVLRATANLQAQQSMVIGGIQELSVIAKPPSAESTAQNLDDFAHQSTVKRKRQGPNAMRVTLPNWICQSIWQLSFERAAGNWTVCMITSRILPPDHAAWTAVRSGRVAELRSLVETGMVTTYDRCEMGSSLLSRAIFHGQTKTVEYLIGIGANNDHIRSMRFPGFLDYSPGFLPLSLLLHDVQAHTRAILKCDEDDLDEGLRAACQVMSKDATMWTVEDRVQVLAELAANYKGEFCAKVKQSGNLTPELFEATAFTGGTLLHTIAEEFAETGTGIDSLDVFEYGLRVSGNTHKLDSWGRTPFYYILLGTRHNDLQARIVSWTTHVRNAGVNLEEYGKTELEIYRSIRGPDEKCLDPLISFTYGAMPSDWQVWLRHPGDPFSHDFWYGVEVIALRVPGAWPDIEDETCTPYDTPDYAREHCSDITRQQPGVKRRTLRMLSKELRDSEPDGEANLRQNSIRGLLEIFRKEPHVSRNRGLYWSLVSRRHCHTVQELKEQLGL